MSASACHKSCRSWCNASTRQPASSILFIEQPELHLHPRAQAHLADLLIDVLASREDGEPRNIQLIIETHSEHFLNRLQRRIAEADAEHPISTEQVAAYFAHTTGSESKLEELEFNTDGDILNWPPNFFGDSMGDLFEKSKAAARRRQRAARCGRTGRPYVRGMHGRVLDSAETC